MADKGAPSVLRELTGLTGRVSEFVQDLTFDAIPGDVVEKAKLIVRDGLANQVAASAISDSGKAVVELCTEWGGKPESTVIGYGVKLPSGLAALCNGTLGHGVELDDAHGTALLKAGSVLIPAAFAIAETHKVSGKELLTALVAGYEVSIRLAKAINPGHRQRGYHTTSSVGTIGAAVITTKLLGCDADTIASAIGLAAMHSAGIQAYLDFPCMAKPLGPGRAAFNGVLSGSLAKRGFAGPKTVLEGSEGFLRAMTDKINPEHVRAENWGKDFTIMEVGFKPHAACRYAHGAIDIAQRFHRESGVRGADVDTIDVRMSQLAIRQASKTECPTLGTAMGSTEFGVALGLLVGSNGLKDYWKGFENADVHALTRRVNLIVEPAYGLGGRQVKVDLKTRDGRTLTIEQEEPRGEPSNPLSAEDLAGKFAATAGLVLDDARTRHLGETVMNLESVSDAASVPPLTVVGESKPSLRVA